MHKLEVDDEVKNSDADSGAFTSRISPDVSINSETTLMVNGLPKGTQYVGVNLTELKDNVPVLKGAHFHVIAIEVVSDGTVARVTFQRHGSGGVTPVQAGVFWHR